MGRHHQRSHREAAHLQHSKVNSSELEEKQIPPLPKTVADIRLEGKWSETGQPVLLLDDTFHNSRIIVYATPDNLQDFAAPEMFFCDGTFYTCPGLDGMEN